MEFCTYIQKPDLQIWSFSAVMADFAFVEHRKSGPTWRYFPKITIFDFLAIAHVFALV